MAKKPANSNKSSKKPISKSAPARASTASSSVRNTPIPRQPAKPQSNMSIRREPTQAEIAKRAYEIWQSGKGGSQMENWLRAERELRGAGGTGR
jgi:hypothetical protein